MELGPPAQTDSACSSPENQVVEKKQVWKNIDWINLLQVQVTLTFFLELKQVGEKQL